MDNTVVRLYKPPKATLTDPLAQVRWVFFQMEREYVEPTASGIRHARNKYMQYIAETNAYYSALELNPRFYLLQYWEADALIRFNRWLICQEFTSKTQYSVYKHVRRTMDFAYALRIIDNIVYHALMFKGVPETKERAAYAKREQEVINASIARWLNLAYSVAKGYEPSSEGIPYRKRLSFSHIVVDGIEYPIGEASKKFGVAINFITNRLKEGYTRRQAVGLDPIHSKSSLNWRLNGKVYQTKVEILRDFGIESAMVRHRLKRGWTPKQIVGLEPPPASKVTGKAVPISLDGHAFASIKAACAHFGLMYGTVLQRLILGWTVEQAFELSERDAYGTKIVVEDVKYDSIEKAATAYGMGPRTVGLRLQRGYTPEQAMGLVPIHVKRSDERALLWSFENDYECDSCAMLEDFRKRGFGMATNEPRLRRLFLKWGVWPYVDDRLIMPLFVELAMLTGLNVEALKALEIDSFQSEHRLTGQPVISYRKSRSGSAFRSEDRELHLAILELEEFYPAEKVVPRIQALIGLTLKLTSTIREYAGVDVARKLFIFEDIELTRKTGARQIISVNPNGKAVTWFRRFSREEGFGKIIGPRFNFNVARCRPTLATNMILAGADLFQVQVALGGNPPIKLQ